MKKYKENQRWLGYIKDLKGTYPKPEVWAKSEKEALQKVKEGFKNLLERHKKDFTWKLFCPESFDLDKIEVKHLGSGMLQIKPGTFKVEPMKVPDFDLHQNLFYDFKD